MRRPEPQALWNKTLTDQLWNTRAQARFLRGFGKSERQPDIKGQWEIKSSVPSKWAISYKSGNCQYHLILKLTSSGHVGVFPEQAPNWDFVCGQVKKLVHQGNRKPRVLNLFAYTGSVSLAALAEGAEVTHLDAVRQMINWTEENREKSQLPKLLKLVVEDVMKFLAREIKRGNKYQGIILDPPSYGRGPSGEKWILEDQINSLISSASKLLDPEIGFFVLNWYSVGLSPYVMVNLVKEYFTPVDPEFGEMIIRSGTGILLPLGTYLRFSRT